MGEVVGDKYGGGRLVDGSRAFAGWRWIEPAQPWSVRKHAPWHRDLQAPSTPPCNTPSADGTPARKHGSCPPGRRRVQRAAASACCSLPARLPVARDVLLAASGQARAATVTIKIAGGDCVCLLTRCGSDSLPPDPIVSAVLGRPQKKLWQPASTDGLSLTPRRPLLQAATERARRAKVGDETWRLLAWPLLAATHSPSCLPSDLIRCRSLKHAGNHSEQWTRNCTLLLVHGRARGLGRPNEDVMLRGVDAATAANAPPSRLLDGLPIALLPGVASHADKIR